MKFGVEFFKALSIGEPLWCWKEPTAATSLKLLTPPSQAIFFLTESFWGDLKKRGDYQTFQLLEER